jgi:hypothetical protein
MKTGITLARAQNIQCTPLKSLRLPELTLAHAFICLYFMPAALLFESRFVHDESLLLAWLYKASCSRSKSKTNCTTVTSSSK